MRGRSWQATCRHVAVRGTRPSSEEETVEQQHPERDTIDVEQGGGPPVGTAWTLEVPDEGWEADLEHAAPLPRIGEKLEYIGEDGRRRTFRVREVVHVLQPSATDRPPVREESSSPNSTVNEGSADRAPSSLRAGLPRVVVAAEEAPVG
jgi:hypothetical protein